MSKQFIAIIYFSSFLIFFISSDGQKNGSSYSSYCPEKTTRCNISSDVYACCPYLLGTCCIDGKHCCPYNHDCDIQTRTCRPKSFSTVNSNKLYSKQTVHEVKNICPGGTDCLIGCCPLPNAQCCSDLITCCPYNTSCIPISGGCNYNVA